MIPIVVLSGFLGSGKTTLLQHALAYYKEKGLKPAILMNELGDVNLDGSLVNGQAPMKEMLSGCICCTIRGDLGVELMNLAEEYKPDVIIVECTGVANPMEIVDAVTDASIYSTMILQSVITVIDARQFLDFASGNERSKSLRLMQDQLRCASKLIINKTDLLAAGELQKVQALVKELNPYVLTVSTQRSDVDAGIFSPLKERSVWMFRDIRNPQLILRVNILIWKIICTRMTMMTIQIISLMTMTTNTNTNMGSIIIPTTM